MTSWTARLIASFVHNPVLANLLALGTFVAGMAVAVRLPRETFPETAINYLLITVVYPGAAPEDVESGVCVKVEQAIEDIPAIWEVSSYSEENFGSVAAAFDPSVTPTAEILRQVQDRVNAIRTFPRDAERPVVTELIARNSVTTLGVHGQAPERVIKRIAQEVRDELLAHAGVSQVSVSGVRDYEISIQVAEETLRQYGLTLQHILESVSRSSLDLPAGTIRTRDEEINIRTTGRRHTVAEFEDIEVLALPDGSSVRLGQIARIRDAFEEKPLFGRIDGEPGALIHVLKTSREDISTVAGIVGDYLRAKQRDLPEGIQLTVLSDRSRDVDARINMLIWNGLMGMGLLLVCLLLFMDFRAAIGVAMGLPVALAGALLVMGLTGQSLNLISLFGLIMADAIVLDDSIVIADSVLAHERRGMAPALAAIEGTRVVSGPVITASLTTCIMFIPMMFVEGTMGKLIFVLPVVVLASIVASVGEAFFILPAHLSEWAGPRRTDSRPNWRRAVRGRLDRWIELGITRVYRPLIERMIRARLLVLAGSAAALMLCAGLVLGGRTPFVLFPKVDCNTLRARIRFPEGTPIETSQAAVARMEQAALALNRRPDGDLQDPSGKLVRNMHSLVGGWSEYVPKVGSSLCETTIELMPAEKRRVDASLVMEQWRAEIGPQPYGASLHITREELGPSDKPFEVHLLGDDLTELRQAADELEAKLATFAGVFDIGDDLLPGKREAHVTLKPAAYSLGLTVGDLARQLRVGLHGAEAVRLQRGREDVRVVVSYLDEERRSLQAVDHLRIQTRVGEAVPFHEVAEMRMVRGYSSIGRRDGHRRIRVQADVDERHANAEQIVQSLEKSFLPEIPKKYPGVTFQIDGQRKRIAQSMQSLGRSGIVCLLLTYAVLGAAMKSYVQPLILMSAVPLGLAGAVLGHTILGYDLSLMSVFGMTSVAGIVVNDGLVLVDQIKRNLAEGMSVHEAVARGSESRVIAVFLTAMTNVAGMAPLLAERSTQAVPLIPIAISVAFGLCFAMVLTLFIVPALYFGVNDLRRFVHWLRRGGAYPTAEFVEPVSVRHAVPSG